MNYLSLVLAALGATVAYFAFGFLLFWQVPSHIDEARKYPAVFRPNSPWCKSGFASKNF